MSAVAATNGPALNELDHTSPALWPLTWAYGEENSSMAGAML